MALGLAILSALATARTHSLLAAHQAAPDALAGGYTRALLGAAFFVGAVVIIGLRAGNTKGEPPGGTPAEITGVDTAGAASGDGPAPARGDGPVHRAPQDDPTVAG